MNYALISLTAPLVSALLLVFLGYMSGRKHTGLWVLGGSVVSLVSAALALQSAMQAGLPQTINLGGWAEDLGISLRLSSLSALLLVFTAFIHLLVGTYARFSRHAPHQDFWMLSAFLHASLNALWLSADLFNLYITLELIGLAAVAMVALSGARAYKAASDYLLLSLAASLIYLLGVVLIYAQYQTLNLVHLASISSDNTLTRLALVLMTAALMLKGALWPLHLWLPAAHASAPTAVSALLSGIVVKAPLFILWLIWTELAPPELAKQVGPAVAAAGMIALSAAGWSAMRTPYIKVLVAYSTIAQLGYALMALGLLMSWQLPQLHIALWLFVIAHGLAKTSLFLAAGEMQGTLGTKRLSGLRGATQTVPVAMFAFAVAGGSLIGLPPSGGFLAKWVLLEPMLNQPQYWPWALGVLLGTLVSAAYIFRVVALSFDRARINPPDRQPDRAGHWLALLPALLVWGMALIGNQLILILAGGGI
ncbi:complex I subunit 5 family protein [Pseudohongiella spirulinae]|uniref:NADH dehydrogenase n=1 Tax=Pseudohongiella spirulinae TaxID=1249552 RepID=A0A0S2K9V2_9GAMM|nr:proton-conducting transporter membrane subunit [Pseudohongiella spirulinae]ALO45032.1 NADH dehydrogenase [Pseudohongiella spirulinae]